VQAPTFDDRPVWDVWLSVYWMPSLIVADELELFEALQAAPASAEELAARLDLNAAALRALLPLLTSLGFLVLRLGRYQLAGPAPLYLIKRSPLYWGHAFSIHRQNPWVTRLTAALKARSAQPQDLFHDEHRPVDGWESGQLDPEMARNLCAFMHSHSVPAAQGLAGSSRFSTTHRLLDVGGGSGCFSIALAERWPQLRCTVMELPVMCELAQPYIDASSAHDRVETKAVDMFRQDWPGGYDAIFMSNVIHDWDEPTCAKLAAAAFATLEPGGHIHLHEMLMADDGSGPISAAGFAMLMLVGTKGRQYSAAELYRLLEGAGFVDIEIDPAYGYFSLVTGHKPQS
jgi:acetylserotonin N-methyltransferase